jgi:hypothetical protein
MDSCEHACGGWSVSRTVTAPPWQTGTERTLRGTRAAGASRRYRRRSRTRTRTRAGRRARHDPGARHLCAGELCDSGLRRVRHDGNRSEQSVERQRHPQHSGRAGGRQRRGCGAGARDQLVVVGVGADVSGAHRAEHAGHGGLPGPAAAPTHAALPRTPHHPKPWVGQIPVPGCLAVLSHDIGYAGQPNEAAPTVREWWVSAGGSRHLWLHTKRWSSRRTDRRRHHHRPRTQDRDLSSTHRLSRHRRDDRRPGGGGRRQTRLLTGKGSHVAVHFPVLLYLRQAAVAPLGEVSDRR